MSVRSSSAGLRSQGLFDRIRSERRRRSAEGGTSRVGRLAGMLGKEEEDGMPTHSLRPAGRRARKPR
jgi:hypothetical protein